MLILARHEDLDYQLLQRESELCRLCALWQSKVRGVTSNSPGDGNWGPSEEAIKEAASLEVTGISTAHTDSCSDAGEDTDSSESDGRDDGDLLEEMETLLLTDLYHLDSAAYDVEDDHLSLYTS